MKHSTSYPVTFYCPLKIYRFPNSGLAEMQYIDDIFEDGVLEQYEMESPADAKGVIANHVDFRDMFHSIGCCGFDSDKYKQLNGVQQNTEVQISEIDGGLWLQCKCDMESEAAVEWMRSFLADCIMDYYAQPWEFESGGDAYMMIPYPYEFYNQSSCAAPPSQENALLTEEELRQGQDESEDQGMGGLL